MHLSTLDPAGLPAVASFVAALNEDPAHHVGYWESSPDEIVRALAEFEVAPEEAFVVAHDTDGAGSALQGVFGFEADIAQGKVWLFGPMIDAPDDATWQATADALWAALAPRLPAVVRRLEIFCHTENTRLQAFAARIGLSAAKPAVIMRFDREVWAGLAGAHPSGEAELVRPEQHTALAALHDEIFPGTYYSGEQVLARLNAERQVWVVAEGQALLGYLYVEARPGAGEANIEFVGVHPTARRRGIGRRLALAALRGAFADERIARMFLVTNPENTAALTLFRQLGFVLQSSMVGWRREE